MKPKHVFLFLSLFIFALGTVQFSAQSPSRKRAKEASRQLTEKIVREYLMKHPEVIREALAALQTKETAERTRLVAVTLKKKEKEIFSTPADPFSGNPDADVSIAVFFDYTCGYCRKTMPSLKTLIEKDPSVRIVYKEFPILGSASHTASLAALAAGRQGKYLEFHNGLMEANDLGITGIKNIAEQLGLDHTRLLKDMADPQLVAQIARNASLANALNIHGTPAYVVADQIIPGAIDAKSLARIVEKQRAKKKESDIAVKD
jgi:protein-disulfide isomerase